MTDSVDKLRNLGPQSCRWLRECGITTIEELRSLGTVAAFQIVKAQQPKASLNLLWGLAAGLEDRDWRELADAEKESLLWEVGDE